MNAVRATGIISAATLLLSAGVAFAQERPTTAVPDIRPRVERAMIATTTKTEVREIKRAAEAEVRKIKRTAQERVKAVREEAKVRVETVRTEAKARLADIRDKKKQETAEKLAARLENLNTTWTDHFAKLLDRYRAVLEKMQKRSDAAAANGRDVTAANAAIELARNALSTVQNEVAVQASKTYTIDTSAVPTTVATTTSEGQRELVGALKTAFQQVHATVFKDLFALRDGQMKDVRALVQDALQALGKVPGVDEVATPTAQPGE